VESAQLTRCKRRFALGLSLGLARPESVSCGRNTRDIEQPGVGGFESQPYQDDVRQSRIVRPAGAGVVRDQQGQIRTYVERRGRIGIHQNGSDPDIRRRRGPGPVAAGYWGWWYRTDRISPMRAARPKDGYEEQRGADIGAHCEVIGDSNISLNFDEMPTHTSGMRCLRVRAELPDVPRVRAG
jgi:hypothetical protein